ncbi:stage V sporulation protein AA [Paenibacillus jilunlii]|uniref:Stage V sporulation protein AA n=1 Tax=Paenibacillus jilunlii TaxID=682956 RepID=A0A1G9RCU3_9BACL|nr:stage V sporulation protein AA [Paenibacillus jilunlii]KWX76727.1 stage V sporulation protein AA [Paenibacillus jilunlii]SDM21086.1 stage V sporulation protein AA [Paenibacillus jilunlii]
MTAYPAPAIYIQLKNRVTVPKGKDVLLRDVAYLITDPEWREPLYSLLVLDPVQSDGNLILIDLLTVIPKIHELVPGADIQPIGEGRTLVQIEGPAEARKPSIALFVLVWLLLFFGSALTIMNFHADVSMLEVQVRIVEMLTGRRDEHPYVFQIAYSLGIGFGMVIFFNHLFKKKWNEEPTPLEVEMFLYQKNIDHYVVNEEYSKMKNHGDEPSRHPERGKRS